LTSGVLLQDVTEDHIPIFFEHQRDPEACHMAAFAPRDRQIFTAHWANILADDTIIKKTILFAGQVAGNVVSFEQFGKRQVGYWIGKRYWGKGIATMALSAFLDHVPTRPLYAHVATHNIASRRVLEKCGFTMFGEDTAVSTLDGEEITEYVLILRARASDAAY
jgi:RimJ/RimL family protein N-acetyltransferase